MKILGMYTQLTLSILRRVKAPFSVLASRGHSFSFMQVENLTAGLSYGYDVTVLPNWVLSDDEIEELEPTLFNQRTLIYDLSDLRLLEIPQVRKTLTKVQMVTVPNTYFQKEVRGINPRTEVLPSCVDTDFFWGANRAPRPETPNVGCFGPYHWHLIRDAITTVKDKHPQVTFLAGPEASQALGGELVTPIMEQPVSYAEAVHSCLFGLCPLDGAYDQVDQIWREEYGSYGRPTLALNFTPRETELWVKHMETYLFDPVVRRMRGEASFEQAYIQRAVKVADQYLKVYRKKLPHLFISV